MLKCHQSFTPFRIRKQGQQHRGAAQDLPAVGEALQPRRRELRLRLGQSQDGDVRGVRGQATTPPRPYKVDRLWIWRDFWRVVIGPHRAAERVEMEKTSQGFWRVPWEQVHWELWNEPPLDMSQLTPEIPFMASLWIRSGYDMKVGKSAETYQVGAHFKALIKAILVAPSRTLERFFSFRVSLPRCAYIRLV